MLRTIVTYLLFNVHDISLCPCKSKSLCFTVSLWIEIAVIMSFIQLLSIVINAENAYNSNFNLPDK